MGRSDHKIQDRRFHLEREWLKGATIWRAREGKSVEGRHAITQRDNGDVILFRRGIGGICRTGAAPIAGMCHVRIRLGKANGVPLQFAVEHALNILRVNLRLQDVGSDSTSRRSTASRER